MYFLPSNDSEPEFNQQQRRRAFLKFTGGCAALSSTSVLSQLLSLKLTSALYAQSPVGPPKGELSFGSSEDYKALVCVFLNGGIDSFNVLAPYEDAEHSVYTTVRSTVAKPKSQLLPIPVNIANPTGRRLGIHDGMPKLQELYLSGKLAFLANVGSLIVPTTKTTYNNGLAKKPLGLFSHADLIQHWQTAMPHSRSQASGWGGRMADLLTASSNTANLVSMNIALGSSNLMQTGSEVLPFVVGSNGTVVANTSTTNTYDRVYDAMRTGSTANTRAMLPPDTLLGSYYSDLLKRSFSKTKRTSIDSAINFNSSVSVALPATAQDRFNAIASSPTISSSLKTFAANLNMVARTINARAALGQKRQIFFISLGGWDHHDNLLTNQGTMLPGLSEALSAFYLATEDMLIPDKVTTFTASDFGRTLSANSTGTDHAWGGNQIVLGGGVAGGQIYGTYPTSLALNGELDLGRGRLIPTTSVDMYNAELATWFGITNSQLTDVLPNIRNFYSAGSTSRPLGFLPNV